MRSLTWGWARGAGMISAAPEITITPRRSPHKIPVDLGTAPESFGTKFVFIFYLYAISLLNNWGGVEKIIPTTRPFVNGAFGGPQSLLFSPLVRPACWLLSIW